ncbi:DUF6098 family protein [Streptomyces sp. NPDC001351]|uniref:DUF6098 family protein n=1 Tax=Streptomyces sp. NPDC001351 TaxID=3364564 RepID=UPI003687BFD1
MAHPAPATGSLGIPTFSSLHELAGLVAARRGLYVRWSVGPEEDLAASSSTDDLTGVSLPGLSANPLDIEDWWGDRPTHIWVARRLYDYSHLPRVRDGRIRPWALAAKETGRGPDNEPLVTDVQPLGWISPQVITEADTIVTRQQGSWGPLNRDSAVEG